MKLTPCKLKQLVREEARRLNEIGWDNLPDGWDEDSVESFAQNLTGQEGEEGFFTACMDEVEDKFDDPEAFCASLKDEYLGTTDWRNESINKSNKMKLTESKLRSIIREELLQEARTTPATSIPEVENFLNTYISNVKPSDVDVMEAAGNRYIILIPKNKRFDVNLQAFSGRMKDAIVSIGNLTSPNGEISLVVEL